MQLILTSDFPNTANTRVADALRRTSDDPRVAWIPAATEGSASLFAIAQERFRAAGVAQLEHVDIDEDLDQVQIAYLHEFDIVFLAAGDAVRFRYNAIRSGMAGRLRQCLHAGRLIVGAGGGALLLTPNVSLARLHEDAVEGVLATRGRFDALGAVPYELLPHANRSNAGIVEKARAYSEHVEHDVIALADGGAIFHRGDGDFSIDGTITRYRKGQIIEA